MSNETTTPAPDRSGIQPGVVLKSKRYHHVSYTVASVTADKVIYEGDGGYDWLDNILEWYDIVSPIPAAPVHVAREAGQRWGVTYKKFQAGMSIIELVERVEGGWKCRNIENSSFPGWIHDAHWDDGNVYGAIMTLLSAPKAEAATCVCSGRIKCGLHYAGRDAEPATADEGPVATGVIRCGNNGCKTPHQNVAWRWCQGVDQNGVKTGATLEESCEPCHLLDEADWAEKMMFETSGAPYKGPERLTRPRLAHSMGVEDPALEDC